MPFHVEVATGRRHARSFNLTEEELGRTVLEPWLSGRPILLGDRRWTRDEESSLRVLQGPELSVQDLAFSQGWSNAQRSAADVTAAVLGAATAARGAGHGPTAVLIRSDAPARTLADLISGHDAEAVSIDQARAQIDSQDPRIAAVILVVHEE